MRLRARGAGVSRATEDEEADESAVLAPERERQGRALAPELAAVVEDQLTPGLGLAEKPARHLRHGDTTRAARELDRAVGAVVVPGDEEGELLRPRPLEGVDEPEEERRALARPVESGVERAPSRRDRKCVER